jgi:hypothetical protein
MPEWQAFITKKKRSPEIQHPVEPKVLLEYN